MTTIRDYSQYPRLSELSRRVLYAAEQIAASLDYQGVGVGHLLLALLAERRSPVSSLLRESGLDEAQLHENLPVHEVLLADIDGTLNDAVVSAEQLGSHFTGTEHLVIALVQNPAVRDALRQHGANVSALRRRLLDGQ